MTLRTRLTLVAAAAVALAVVVASAAIFFVVRARLNGQVDDSLERRAAQVVREQEREVVITPEGELARRFQPPALDSSGTYVQFLTATGSAVPPQGLRPLIPPDERAIGVAEGRSPSFFTSDEIGSVRVRVLTAQLDAGIAVQVARSLEEVDETLRELGWILGAVCVVAIVAAGALGRMVARTTLAPVRNLTDATERITSTSDLSQRISEEGNDELARLARSFNQMLEALERAAQTQRQLVADASHELRTPLTSLRTNIEVLGLDTSMNDEDRRRLLGDVVTEIEQLSLLVGDVVELAREQEPVFAIDEVRFDEIVDNALDTARRRHPSLTFAAELEETVVRGAPERLERAVANLLDNAAKWSPDGSDVEIRLDRGELTVRDHGPGIAPEDLPHLFERFYRAQGARKMPGSGLGLAIVRQIADSHGGEVVADNASGGGAIFRFRLPTSTDSEGR